MCYSGCPYEKWSGECKGRGLFAKTKANPHCMDDEDFEAFVEDYDSDLCDRQDYEEARQHGF